MVCPPYDVVSLQDRENLHHRHPLNFIRIILGKELPGDTEYRNKYTRAAQLLKSWREEKILISEAQPSMYVSEQRFSLKGQDYTRTSFISLVKLEDYQTGNIHPHEVTLPKQKEDRLNLLRACKANLDPIFVLYPEEDTKSKSILESVTSRTPDAEFHWDGTLNKLWTVKDWQVIDSLTKLLENKPLFIADGHHRYEVSLAYKEELKDKPPGPHHFTMIALVSTKDPGLCILPIHRVIKLPKKLERPMEDILEESFYVEYIKGGNLTLMEKRLQESPIYSYGLFLGDTKEYYLLTLRNLKLLKKAFPNTPECLLELEVTVLHSLAIDRLLGNSSKFASANLPSAREENNIRYVHDSVQAISLVESGEYDIAFFINPTPIEHVSAVASQRLKMPPKSTFFYPKLLSGLVINPLE
ncbi:MAG TPA: DUF1015 domain-containing protein [Candidatus Hypogeohydataceae bacterium YC41]